MVLDALIGRSCEGMGGSAASLRGGFLGALFAVLAGGCLGAPVEVDSEEVGAERDEDILDADGQALAPRDSWAARVARIQQRDLQRNVPLNEWQRIGTHNSHVSTNYRKDGDRQSYYARANQHASIREQLDMGVRTLMLDVYDNDSPTLFGDCTFGWKVCFSHAGEAFSQWSIAIEDEIATWINAPENQNEVLLILLEDYFDNGDDNKQQFFAELLRRFDRDYWPGVNVPGHLTTGDLIFRPVDKQSLFPERWPTTAELAMLGKRIMIAVKDRSRFNLGDGMGGLMSDWFFRPGNQAGADAVQLPGYDANFAPQFRGNACGSARLTNGSGSPTPLPFWFTQFEELKICDHFELCSFPYDASIFTQRIDVRGVVECGFSVAVDHVEADPGRTGKGYDYYSYTMKQAIWSFGEGEPNDAGGNEDCAEMRADGRWNDVPCTGSRRFACKRSGAMCSPASCSSDFWMVTSGAGAWSGGFDACPQGYEFVPPVNGYENKKLRERAGGVPVWLNFTDRQVEGRWQIAPYQSWGAGEPSNAGGGEHCASVLANGTWNDLPCNATRHTACQRSGVDCGPLGCPDDFWVISSTTGTWGASDCPAGYVFRAPRNGWENDKLQQTLDGGPTVWVNLSDAHEEGLWEAVWSGSFSAWNAGEPNNHAGAEHCAEMTGEGTWNDRSCSESLPHACWKVGSVCTSAGCPSDAWRLGGSGPSGTLACPAGHTFGVPRSRVENARLKQVAGGQRVWLNFSDAVVEGRWR
ncbi:lectin-like protein [Chondromyces crocatus]|uniref:C-type lectin domain-containing protein n=1 Tax=Chondromyces crocatus TaxID=52 RepID=A0A0K1ETH4_CHOCO|nr:lectin-like protein [Chondromyces crocatus]AKT44079.1 uncharacterized protein CMC5_083170 [Chondromyces crocatus]